MDSWYEYYFETFKIFINSILLFFMPFFITLNIFPFLLQAIEILTYIIPFQPPSSRITVAH